MSELVNLVIFSHQGVRYCLNSEIVRELIWLPEITPTEEVPPYIIGLINLRGTIIPVINLAILFGRPQAHYQLSDQIIIIILEKQLAGILVNEVYDVITVPQSDIIPILSYTTNTPVPRHYLEGMITLGKEIYMFLEPSYITRYESMREITNTYLEKKPTIQNIFCPEASSEERAVFHERALSLLPLPEEPVTQGKSFFAIISLNGEYYGVALEDLREFSKMHNITPIPCTPEYIIGNMNLRGDILTIIDIRYTLNIPVNIINSSSSMVMITEITNPPMGVVIDDLIEILCIDSSEIKQVPAAHSEISSNFFKGSVVYKDKLLILLDLLKLFTNDNLTVNSTD